MDTILRGLDYGMISSLLSEEEILVQHTARDFVEAEVLPVITQHHRDETFPEELVPRLGELGYLGSVYPEEYGGAGLGAVAYGLLNQELERGDSALRSFVSVQTSLVMYPIWAFGSDEQKRRWLPALASGKAIGCFGLTEPDAGSDPGAMRTRASRTTDGWVLSGAKMWITNGTIAHLAIVWARDDQGEVQGFIVERGFNGFSAPKMVGKLSLRASITSELLLDEVPVPEANRLPGAHGLAAPLKCLTQARYSVAWGVIGAAMACYETALRYAGERIQFGKPIAAFQLSQRKLVWMVTEITKAQLLAVQLGRLKEQNRLRYQLVALAKRNNVWMARECARLARELLGANGIIDEYPVMRHLMNLESVYTYEGTHEMHTLIVGEDLTGLSAFN
ncbi:MAG: acyl-CoA dehydrogenase family protein [Candidatus Marinimicrobia bacterium]|nr:acyl-CoA dehydrogenase family protein [Candidatus Neomarinimicrobiota bacterium]